MTAATADKPQDLLAALRDSLVAAIGDWHGPLPSTGMIGQCPTWRGQWMSHHGTREKWDFQARVARRHLQDAVRRGDAPEIDRSRNLVIAYSTAALCAPTSVWLVVTGRHRSWYEPADTDADGTPYDDDHEPVEVLAGPFPTEDAADDYCATNDLEDVTIVARLPWAAEA